MVSYPGASLRAGGGADGVEQLQALNRPRPVRVRCDRSGQPAAVMLDSGWASVTEVADEWRIEDEWWRTPICRRYVSVVLVDGRAIVLFEDLEDAGDARWYRQHVALEPSEQTAAGDRRPSQVRIGAPIMVVQRPGRGEASGHSRVMV